MLSKMFKNSLFVLIALWFFVFFLTSCDKKDDISVIPLIKFENYKLFKDAANRDTALSLTISFEDGDGDLGLEQGDTLPPFNPGSKYYACMFIYYFEFVDSLFQEVRPEISGIPIGDTIRFRYRFRNLTPTTPNKAIRGQIEWHTNQIIPIKNNTIKFKIYIYDRALNKSNTVESPAIVYNP